MPCRSAATAGGRLICVVKAFSGLLILHTSNLTPHAQINVISSLISQRREPDASSAGGRGGMGVMGC